MAVSDELAAEEEKFQREVKRKVTCLEEGSRFKKPYLEITAHPSLMDMNSNTNPPSSFLTETTCENKWENSAHGKI